MWTCTLQHAVHLDNLGQQSGLVWWLAAGDILPALITLTRTRRMVRRGPPGRALLSGADVPTADAVQCRIC
jgi:hypothetical protein